MKEIKHKHHIIPRHMGGSDDPSNLIELTIEEHAEAHKALWEEHQKIGDYIAWKALSGQWTAEEISEARKEMIKQLQQKHGKITGSLIPSKESLQKRSETMRRRGIKPWNTGKSLKDDPTNESLLKLRERSQQARERGELSNIGDHMRGQEFSEEHKRKLSEIKLNAEKKTCPHCGKQAKAGMYARWHGDNCRTLSKDK